MEDRYYSKSLQRHFPTRLDVLLYAHDGRGLGHASRTVAVGLALRRLFPERRVLFVSGSADTGMLIGPAPLDWIKLPAYQTVLKDGLPAGQDGPAGFYKSVLGGLRSEMLAALVDTLRPRCVLVDHNPTGKRQELLGALENRAASDTRWILGLRGVIGEDPYLWTDRTADIVERYYHQIVWYGDRQILGDTWVRRIRAHFKQAPLVAGYVSRLAELRPYLDVTPRQLAGTVSIPWMSDRSEALIQVVHTTLNCLGQSHGKWHLYVPQNVLGALRERFQDQPLCDVRPVSAAYLTSLLKSRVALIYGGYNSLMDVAAARIPAVVILRGTRDREQISHLTRFSSSGHPALKFFAESDLRPQILQNALEDLLNRSSENSDDLQSPIDIRGAETTARFIESRLDGNS